MKKRVIFIVLSLLVLSFFACEFTIPTAIEIHGSPSVQFKEKVEIGKMFTDILDKAVNESNTEGVTILSCENTEDFTFLVHMELFNQDFDLNISAPVLPDLPGIELGDILGDLVNHPVTLTENKYIIKSDEPREVPFSSIGSLLDGFEFEGHLIKLYFSGSKIVNKIRVDIKFYTIEEDGTLTEKIQYNEKVNVTDDNITIDIDAWKDDGYTATVPPEGGFPIDLPLNGKDMAVSFRVYIPAGEELEFSDLQGGQIKVEAVIWLPIVLRANKEGAEISFPDDALFSSENDLFGRDSPDAENIIADIIESLKLEMKFTANPFSGADLIVWSKPEGSDGIEIVNTLTDDSIPFIISEDDMQKINAPENWPFTPNFKLRFHDGDTLKFPREFNATEVIFSAKIKYRLDF